MPAEWFHRHFDALWRLVARLGVAGHSVDDVVQEAFIAASRRRTDIREGQERRFSMGTAVRLSSNDVAFVSGSSTRLGGPQTLPIRDAIAARPGGLPFPLVIEHQNHTFEQDRVVFTASNAGDLNGDGADDLLTTSMALLRSDETGSSFASPQIHIHYGTPGGASAATIVR